VVGGWYWKTGLLVVEVLPGVEELDVVVTGGFVVVVLGPLEG
jgi:hypothetical protein